MQGNVGTIYYAGSRVRRRGTAATFIADRSYFSRYLDDDSRQEAERFKSNHCRSRSFLYPETNGCTLIINNVRRENKFC